MKWKINLIIFILFLLVIPIINADITSINSGGTQEIIISPSEYIEGFFGSSEEEIPVTPVTPTPSAGGGGGAGLTPSKIGELIIYNTSLDISIAKNTVKTIKIGVYNKGEKEMNVYAEPLGLDELVIVNKKDSFFKLSPHETKNIEVVILSVKDPGIYTGKILINGQVVLVTININTKELLFDINVVIPDEFKIIRVGEKLDSQITLIPMGENSRLDVTLNYIIKDFDGKSYLAEKDTFLIDGQKTFKKTFATQNLPIGNYILGAELIYPNGVATSASHFQVISAEKKISNYKWILILLICSIFLLLIGIYLLIRRYKHLKSLNKKKYRKFTYAQ